MAVESVCVVVGWRKRNLGRLRRPFPFKLAEALLQAPTKDTVFVTPIVVIVASKRVFTGTLLPVGGFVTHNGELGGLQEQRRKRKRKEENNKEMKR